MGISKLKMVCEFLGPMYEVKKIDQVETVYRRINDAYEFEITGFFSRKPFTVNLWQITPHRELMVIYSGIQTKEDLADVLGYLAFKCKNLSSQIQVEREDLKL